jgi:hypothetical protein
MSASNNQNVSNFDCGIPDIQTLGQIYHAALAKDGALSEATMEEMEACHGGTLQFSARFSSIGEVSMAKFSKFSIFLNEV